MAEGGPLSAVIGDRSASGEFLVEMRRVEKPFPVVHARRGARFNLKAGEAHALMGGNGAGKRPFLDHRFAEIFTNPEARMQWRFGCPSERSQASEGRVLRPTLKAALASRERAVYTPAG